MTTLYFTVTGDDIWRLDEVKAYKMKNLLTNETLILESIYDLSEKKFVPIQMPKINGAKESDQKIKKKRSPNKPGARKSKYKGVSRLGKKWRVQLYDKQKKTNRHLGTYDSELLAAAAYQEHIGNDKEAKRLRNEYEEGDRMPEPENDRADKKNIFNHQTY